MQDSYGNIDRRLADLSEASRKLRSQRNALTSVCRLPSELLAMFFSWVVLAASPISSDFSSPTVGAWYQFTQVCRRWRDVALDCPTLWNHLDITTPRWVQEGFHRSKQAALSLRGEIYATHPRALDSCQIAVCNPSRLHELHIAGDRPSLSTLSGFLTDVQADNLRSLVLCFNHWRSDVDDCEIHSAFLSGGAPRLQRLELWKCKIPLQAPLLAMCPSVTTLVMQGPKYMGKRTSLTELSQVLEKMPALQHLHFEDILPDPAPGEVCLAPLPLHLQTLHLVGTLPQCSSLLRQIRVPPSVSATFKVALLDDMEEIVEFINALNIARADSAKHGISPEPLQSWSFDLGKQSLLLSGKSSAHSMFQHPYPDAREKSAQQYRYGLNLALDWNRVSPWDIVRKLFSELPINLAQTSILLAGARPNSFAEDRWLELLAQMPGLTRIDAHDCACDYLPRAMKTMSCKAPPVDSTQSEDPVTPSIFIPTLTQLESLWFHKANGSYISYAGRDAISFLHALQELQITRSNYGIPIDSLRLTDCKNIGQQEVRTLCHLFVDVDWDGREMYPISNPLEFPLRGAGSRSDLYMEWVDDAEEWDDDPSTDWHLQ